MQAYQVTFRFGNYGDGDGGGQPVVIYGADISDALSTLPKKDSDGNPQHSGIKAIEYVGEIEIQSEHTEAPNEPSSATGVAGAMAAKVRRTKRVRAWDRGAHGRDVSGPE